MKEKIGVVLPSRGLVFSRTMESVFENIKGKDVQVYMAHNLPLPTCFNYPLKKALDDGCTLIWFVEEDMVIPGGTLDKMLEEYSKGSMAVSTEYADRRTGKTLVQRTKKGEVLYSGMGCLLVHRSIFDKMEPPWLRTCVFWLVTDEETGEVNYEPHPELPFKGYGTQDVWLSWNIREQGHQIKIVDAEIGHLQLVERAADQQNQGQHDIEAIYINPNSQPPELLKTFGDW